MDRVNKVKKWVKKQLKNKRFVIITIVFLVLLVAVVFGLTISFSGILGSAYDVDSIEKNIDKIKVGDRINYTANGYSDWKVLSIDKKNKTIDIISRTPTEDVEIKYSDTDYYLDILQATADKYMDGKYAIGARSIERDEIEYGSVEKLGYWVSFRNDSMLEHSSGNLYLDNSYGDFCKQFVPVVTLNVSDTSSLNVNDKYYYSLNGIEEWSILYINGATSISMVPYSPIDFCYKYDEVFNITSFIESEVVKFKDDNVLDVRSFSSNDVGILNSARRCVEIVTGKINHIESNKINVFDGFTEIVDVYTLEQFNICDSSVGSVDYSIKKSLVNGFVPVVTLKYGKPTEKNFDTELKVGDYVKYSANAYDSWKVLSINKEKETVEIVSTTGVKEITLRGKADYDNYENILQAEADRYKNGSSVISARPLDNNDVDTLLSIKIPLDSRKQLIFLNEKKKVRRDKNIFVSHMVMTMSIRNNQSMIHGDESSFLPLYVEALEGDYLSLPSQLGDYSVTAQIFPVIELKMSEVEKVLENNTSINGNINKKPNGQSSNSSSNSTVNTENVDTESDEVAVEEKQNNSEVMREISKLTSITSDLKDKQTCDNIFNFLIIGLICFTFIYFARRK